MVDVNRTIHSAFLARQGAVVTVEWHEASAAAGRVGGGGENGGCKAQRVITGSPQQPTILRQRAGPDRKVLQWRVVCQRRRKNRSASTRRLTDSCGVIRGTPGGNSNSCCSVCTATIARKLCFCHRITIIVLYVFQTYYPALITCTICTTNFG